MIFGYLFERNTTRVLLKRCQSLMISWLV